MLLFKPLLSPTFMVKLRSGVKHSLKARSLQGYCISQASEAGLS